MIPIFSSLASFTLLVILLFIIPVWLGLHLYWKTPKNKSLSKEDEQRLHLLQDTAIRLEQRIQVLESILDQAIPDWRKQRRQ
jgi:phage shock protein B